MSVETRTLKAAVLGLGNMGLTHARSAMASPYVDTVIGYDPNEQAALDCRERLGIATTTDFQAILNDPGIELVYIASPNEFHGELSIASLKAGKNVLCEKPMGTTANQARAMIQAEKESDGFLTIDFECRCSKMYTMVKDWIDQGLIGRPLNTHCDYFCCEFHLKDSWRSNHPGTLIAEKLSHYLDLPRWWLADEVVEVYSINAPNFVTYFNHPDNHQIMFKFKNGAASSLCFIMGVAESYEGDILQDVVAKQAEDGHRLSHMIYGSKGAIETDVFRRYLRRWEFTDSPEKLVSTLVETVTFTKDEDKAGFHNTHDHIVKVSELVAKGKPPMISSEDAFNSMKLVFAAEISERENRVVKLSEI